MPSDASSLKTFTLKRSEFEIKQLRRLCGEWGEAFWKFDDILRAIERPGSLVIYAAPEEAQDWAGAILVDVGPFVADLIYVYTVQAWRRQGVGGLLLRAAMKALADRPQVEDFFLEVRDSNVIAQALYRNHGWEQVDRRPAYYSNQEDALVFRYRLHSPEPGKDSALS